MQTTNEASQQSPATSTAPKRRMSLANVVTGRIQQPLKILVYGVEGIGKSTFGANAPAPIFIDAEKGTAQLRVARLPKPLSWQDVLDGIDELIEAEHSYKTLVIDPLDAIEPLCWARVVANAPKGPKGTQIKHIQDFGFGKGYDAALDVWRQLLSRLERLQDRRGMNVILIAHSWVKTFKDPESEGWDRHEMKLHAKASGLIREWVDAQLFAQPEAFAYQKDSKARTIGVSSGKHVMRTNRTAAYDAKNRFGLPPTIPLDYDDFAHHLSVFFNKTAEEWTADIEAILQNADETLRANVRAAVTKANGDTSRLARYAEEVRARLAENEKSEGEGTSDE